MSEQLGIGAAICLLGGDEESVAAYQESISKTIRAVTMKPDMGQDGAVLFEFADGTAVYASDGARSCCESRYLNCDDDLTAFSGAKLEKMEILDGGSTEDGGEPHEIQFLRVTTDKGSFTVSSHNEHNGYYGGICLTLHKVDQPIVKYVNQ